MNKKCESNMLFNSFQYILFFPLAVMIYFALPKKYKWMFLLAASYYFYMCWKVEYVFLIVFSTLVDYIAGIYMGKTHKKSKRKKFLIISLVFNLGILFVFKYLDFFNENLRIILNEFNIFYNVPAFDLLLPVGISFYTFQTISYSVDIYRGKREPEKHLGKFALYVSFFPQLVAGPIERSTTLLPQFYKDHKFDYKRVTNGIKLILWGLFKKVVIADRLGYIVYYVYNSPQHYAGLPLLITTYFYMFQIYCDFSGYSDIAIGSAQVMGYKLMENFRRPYFARSIAEFWQRWHISLSTWFRDYIFYSLPFRRKRKKKKVLTQQGEQIVSKEKAKPKPKHKPKYALWRIYRNTFIVLFLSAFWHKGSWPFFMWGFLNGFFIVLSSYTKHIREKISSFIFPKKYKISRWLHHFFQVFVTFHLITLTFVFSRSKTIKEAWYIITHMFDNFLKGDLYRWGMGLSIEEFYFGLGSVIFLIIVQLVQSKTRLREFLSSQPIWLRWSAYYLVIFLILVFGVFKELKFVYFQF